VTKKITVEKSQPEWERRVKIAEWRLRGERARVQGESREIFRLNDLNLSKEEVDAFGAGYAAPSFSILHEEGAKRFQVMWYNVNKAIANGAGAAGADIFKEPMKTILSCASLCALEALEKMNRLRTDLEMQTLQSLDDLEDPGRVLNKENTDNEV
jgi:hypothetical protein